MKWADHVRDADLAGPGARAVYHFPGCGVVVRRRDGWYAANDTRWLMVGTVPNEELCQPASGPHRTRSEAGLTIGLPVDP